MPIYSDLLQKLRNKDPNLTMIHMSRARPPLTDSDMLELVNAANGNPYLKTLLLYENAIGDQGCFYLSQLTQIETLSLNSNNITDEGVIKLANMPNLKSLSLADNKMGDKGFSTLMSHPKLEKLMVCENNPISDNVAKMALKNSTLTELFFDSANKALQNEITSHVRSNNLFHQEKNNQNPIKPEPIKPVFEPQSEELSFFPSNPHAIQETKLNTNKLMELKKNAILTYIGTQMADLKSPYDKQELKEILLKEISHLPSLTIPQPKQ